jgi:hypothetical protein
MEYVKEERGRRSKRSIKRLYGVEGDKHEDKEKNVVEEEEKERKKGMVNKNYKKENKE